MPLYTIGVPWDVEYRPLGRPLLPDFDKVSDPIFITIILKSRLIFFSVFVAFFTSIIFRYARPPGKNTFKLEGPKLELDGL